MKSMEQMASRLRGNGELLLEILKAHVTSKNFIKYGNEMNKFTRDQKSIETHQRLLKDVKVIAPNMSFSQKLVKNILHEIGNKKKVEWELSDDELEDWAEECAKRLRTLFTHAAELFTETTSVVRRHFGERHRC